jgi:hypothetical protein
MYFLVVEYLVVSMFDVQQEGQLQEQSAALPRLLSARD